MTADDEPGTATEGVAMDDVTTIRLELTPDELSLVKTAVRLLLDTLGHEEADELERTRALLLKIRALAPD
jgi:hypothetical protein